MALALIASAAPASAQQAVEFLPRFDFYLVAEHLSGDDRRFVWDANFGGELDVVDYGAGRLTFRANYEVVMGDQFRRFDPNQGNYILAGSASARRPASSWPAMFYHQSRHLSDRPKIAAVDWNMVGGRVTRDVAAGPQRVAGQRRRPRASMQKSFVDYRWELDAEGRGRIGLRPGLA